MSRQGPQGVNALRFWSHVLWRDDHPDSCAIWCGNLNELGYGRVRVQGRLRSAHRVAYELTVGPIPENAQVRQRCHDKACCRPEHLYLQPVVRLSPEQVEAILRSQLGARRLAPIYRVSVQRITQLKCSLRRVFVQ